VRPRRRLARGVPPALRHRDFRSLWVAIVAMGLARQMSAVAVGWQVYSISGDPLHLGLIGLAEFLPLPLLAIPAGALADRVSRRLVLAASLALDVAVALLLLVVTVAGASQLWQFLALAFSSGVAGAVGAPAGRAMAPTLVPIELLAGALAIRSVGAQAAVVAGPALGGLLFSVRPELVYATAAGLFGVALLSALAIRRSDAAIAGAELAPRFASLLAGVRFVRTTPILFGAILLDLFAVLFGGAIALLPLFAQDVLHTGPVGLGILRSAPAAGAVVAAIMLVRRPLRGPAGRTLLLVVAVFGASMVVFGLSRWFGVSLAALAVSGFADMFSMNIRSTTVALVTPDELRGRVNAVEMVFISASNELGAFESGVAAALVGAVPAVVLGGAATIVIAAVWPRFFPELARIGRLEDLRPAVRTT
jgi:MFS family permease